MSPIDQHRIFPNHTWNPLYLHISYHQQMTFLTSYTMEKYPGPRYGCIVVLDADLIPGYVQVHPEMRLVSMHDSGHLMSTSSFKGVKSCREISQVVIQLRCKFLSKSPTCPTRFRAKFEYIHNGGPHEVISLRRPDLRSSDTP